MDYLYDGTFEGCLTVLHHCLKQRVLPNAIYPQGLERRDLFSRQEEIETNVDKVGELIDSIYQKIAKQCFWHICKVFISEDEKREMLIFNYLKFGFKVGKDVDRYLSDYRVAPVHSLSRKVGNELHRMKGFVRFDELKDGSYYAPIRTDYYILPLLASHFVNRLSDQNWMIHDVSRKKAIIYDQQNWAIHDIRLDKEIPYDERNDEYRQLWKQYFDTIAIKERINLKLQRQFVPKKYHKYLTEMEKK